MAHDMAYRSLVEKPPQGTAAPSEPEPYYPSLYITAEQFPELFDFDVSDGLEVSFKCKIKSKSESEESSSLCLELRAGSVSKTAKGEYGEKEPVATVVVLNGAGEALEKLVNAKSRRV